jgi:hypothetical protein
MSMSNGIKDWTHRNRSDDCSDEQYDESNDMLVAKFNLNEFRDKHMHVLSAAFAARLV